MKRLECIQAFSVAVEPQFLASAPVAAITQAATQAKAADQTVGNYIRTQLHGKIPLADGWGAAAPTMLMGETAGMTGGASTTSSSSSSSSNPFGGLKPRVQKTPKTRQPQ